MLLHYDNLDTHLKSNPKALYVLVGADQYRLNEAALRLKTVWRKEGDTEEVILPLQQASDWNELLTQANSYSLFSERTLLDLRLDKKTIDATGKDTLSRYLTHSNPRCLMILRAGNLSTKPLPWLSNHDHVVWISFTPLSEAHLKRWILTRLRQQHLLFDPEVPALIHQYTQNNLLASAQVIEKLSLTHQQSDLISLEEVAVHLSDHCEFSLYELADACLGAHLEKALHVLQQANHTRVEPTLVLWFFTQEIRQLIHLSHLIATPLSFEQACTQLKIWQKRAPLYQSALKRLPQQSLYQLLQDSQSIDEGIKTNQSFPIWQAFDRLVLMFCSTPGPLHITFKSNL